MKVVSYKNLPTKLPVYTSALVFLYLDKFNPAQWVWSVVITLLVIYWLLCIWMIAIEDRVEIFKGDDK